MSSAVIDTTGETVEPKVLTSEQLNAAIMKEAELDAEEFDALRRTVKLPGWEIDRPFPPFASTHLITAIFTGSAGDRTDDHMAGDMRVYGRPVQFLAPDGEPAPFFRTVLNRAANTGSRTDVMNLRSFIEDVGHEYACLVVDDEDEEEPTPLCVSCRAELADDAKFCQRCAVPVRVCRATPEGGAMCGRIGELADRFCGTCGTPLPPLPTGR